MFSSPSPPPSSSSSSTSGSDRRGVMKDEIERCRDVPPPTTFSSSVLKINFESEELRNDQRQPHLTISTSSTSGPNIDDESEKKSKNEVEENEYSLLQDSVKRGSKNQNEEKANKKAKTIR